MNTQDIVIYVALAFSTFINILVPLPGSATVTPFLALLTDPHRAIALASFYFLLSGTVRIFIFRKDIQFKYIKRLLPISLLGAVIGAFSLVEIPTTLLLWVVLLFSLHFLGKKLKQVFQKRPELPVSAGSLTTPTVGLLSGFLQGAGLAGSDLRNNLLYAEGLSLSQVYGTTALIGWSNFFIASIVRVFTNQVTISDLFPLLYLLPFLVLATWLGKKTLLKISKKNSDRLILLIMVVVTGLLLLKILKI